MTNKTLNGVQCDPECNWQFEVLILDAEKKFAIAELPVLPEEDRPHNSRILTAEGYRKEQQLHEAYRGLEILKACGRNCTKACGIETFVDSNQYANFGPKLLETINDLKGK